MLTAFIIKALEFIDDILTHPKVKALVGSIGHKIWDAFTTDPKYNSALEVEEKTLESPNLTVEERQDELKHIADLHPKT